MSAKLYLHVGISFSLPLVVVLVLLIGFGTSCAKAEDIETFKSAIEAAQQRQICPPSGEVTTLQYSSYCKQWCDIAYTCHGTPQTDPCQNGDREGCRHLDEGSGKCLRDMNEKNSVIIKYNGIVRQCHRASGQKNSLSSAASHPQGRALGASLQDANRKAEEQKLKVQEALAKANQQRSAADAERDRFKAAAKLLPAWCDRMISACQQRVSSLANASAETKSQCQAYCQNLKIEDCNGASPTIQQAAQACNSDAQNDQRSEAIRQRDEKANKEREATAERRKWHCFGEYGNISQGFSQCRQECSSFFPANHCRSACYASGDGSLSNGRSCFREP